MALSVPDECKKWMPPMLTRGLNDPPKYVNKHNTLSPSVSERISHCAWGMAITPGN